MSNDLNQAIWKLNDLLETTKILTNALTLGDGDKAHEAVSILLMQGIAHFGVESVLMKQFFPVFDAIKGRIDASDISGALGQTRVMEAQIKEVIEIVSNS